MAITATNPVTVPSTTSVTYNQWYLTTFIVEANATKAPAVVTLTRSAVDSSGKTILMPPGPNSSVTFKLDLFAQETAFPAITAAMAAVLTAVDAYAVANKLI